MMKKIFFARKKVKNIFHLKTQKPSSWIFDNKFALA